MHLERGGNDHEVATSVRGTDPTVLSHKAIKGSIMFSYREFDHNFDRNLHKEVWASKEDVPGTLKDLNRDSNTCL